MGRAMAIDPDILDTAADWFASLEGEEPDYDGFTIWLEADARHRAAYDQVIVLDMKVSDHAIQLSSALPANDDAPAGQTSRWRWAGIAAALALFMGTGTVLLRDTSGRQVEVATLQGQMQSIKLADASAVTLDGNSSISFAKDSERAITLARGSAHFAVTHDASRPFSVAAGGYQIRDLGTEFTVSRLANLVSISVSSGLVELSGPGVARLSLHPGDRVDITGGKLEKTLIDPASVGSWRQGRLIYNDTPLRLVVADINRYANRPVQIEPSISGQRFSGVLTIGDGSQLAPTLANVMALPIKTDADGVHLGTGTSH